MKKHGYGIGNMWYGVGNTAAPNPSGAFVDFLDDGTVIVLSGCADIGQGSSTVLAQIAAETLGVGLENVAVIAADTEVTPDAGATSASRQTYISGNAVRFAAEKAREQVIAQAAERLNLPADNVSLKDGQIWHQDEPTGTKIQDVIAQCRSKGILTLGQGWFNPVTTKLDPLTGQGAPYATYAFATQVAEVEADTETGVIEVKRIVAAHDVGRAINPQNVEGQIEGGCIMGMGYALLEEVAVNQGRIENPALSTYLIPTALDIPEMFPVIVEDEEPSGPYGAKGVGEPALVPTAAAIANAVADALGIRLYDLPLTPEKIVAAIRAAAEESELGLNG
ncbi:Molybdopterin-binding domain of aldehyde dehydrogenase [Acididesulfobacillus acetoxydans]|uniref:Molybdopterin-binding domain of aldehyde dehydrogenase n=1 Tax=Acididesulfobacillus acetoxydans TaxID=1561005 RepID=A0A8S0WX93_9FIRM|nr:molybdopterin cofactor-binding domain-containing protein [Acididesulfobacillus acetoxydans]CAA7600821.1 Molybdopterin-binding domain of aldehyde dehydrogenase [Acididesulfobacillus acetoxydans]CEJ09242.1 Nicotinate dehydrogenase medium molybdopterin subunit [Acididesulfobacillus acetoxydans]